MKKRKISNLVDVVYIDERINAKNVQNFKKYKFDGTILYTCTVCKQQKDIFHMISNDGSRMLCTLCAKTYYGDVFKALHEFCLMRNRKEDKK